MIEFEKKKTIEPAPKIEGSRFDKIREAAAEGHKKAAAESKRPPAPSANEDDGLI